MQIKCRYSGELFRAEYFDSFKIKLGEHPIFLLSSHDLLIRVKDWARQDFSEVENRLLFLALLKKTGAVYWNSIPRPAEHIVARNMFPLFKLLGAADLIENNSIPLPKYNISENNADLRNVNQWIACWQEAKDAYFNPRLRWELQARLDKREHTLWKLLNSPGLDSEKFSNRFSKWVMVAADVPQKHFKYFTEIFNLKQDDDKIFSYPLEDIQECYAHIFTNLSSTFGLERSATGAGKRINYSPALRAIEHISRILEVAKAGRIARLDNGKLFEIMDYSSPLAYQQEKEDQLNFREFKSLKDQILEAPEEKPKESDYPNALAYMRAKAAWTLKNNSLSEGQKSVISRLQNEQKQALKEQKKITVFARPISSLTREEEREVIWIA